MAPDYVEAIVQNARNTYRNRPADLVRALVPLVELVELLPTFPEARAVDLRDTDPRRLLEGGYTLRSSELVVAVYARAYVLSELSGNPNPRLLATAVEIQAGIDRVKELLSL